MSEIMKQNLMAALEIMWKGMLGIIVVMVVIAILVFLITYLDKWLATRKTDKTNA